MTITIDKRRARERKSTKKALRKPNELAWTVQNTKRPHAKQRPKAAEKGEMMYVRDKKRRKNYNSFLQIVHDVKRQ